MLTKTLAATAALSMLVAGGSALAAQKKMSPTVAGPKAPVPYDQLNAYLKASPKARASKDWWAGSASTGMPADTAATAPATASDPATTAPATPMSSDTSVNPSPTAAPPSLPMTPPTNAAPQPGDPTMPSQPATPPIEPK